MMRDFLDVLLRDKIARVIELAIIRHGVPEADLEGTMDDADFILAALRGDHLIRERDPGPHHPPA